VPEPVYLTLNQVIEFHDVGMERMGWAFSPLLHHARLDAALNRPRQLAFYEPGADIIAQAIVLAVGISQAQAFLDGNKRTAFAAADTFLGLNGIAFDGDPITFACWLICAAGDVSNDDLDVVAEHLGLDHAADLDAMSRDAVIERFDAWLRSNVSYHDPSELMGDAE
jgi:death-on-curing protein